MKNLLAKWTYYIAIELDSEKSPLFCNILQENQSKQYNKLKNLELNWPNKMYIRDIWTYFLKFYILDKLLVIIFYFSENYLEFMYTPKNFLNNIIKYNYEIQLWK